MIIACIDIVNVYMGKASKGMILVAQDVIKVLY
jgi:hypothetical protein